MGVPTRTIGSAMATTKSRETNPFVVPNGNVFRYRASDKGVLYGQQKPDWASLGTLWRLAGFQTTTSENHPDWVALDRAVRNHQPSPVPSGRDWGGEFTMLKTWIESPLLVDLYHVISEPFFSTTYGTNIVEELWFPLYVPLIYNSSLFPTFAKSSDTTLQALGATAISRCSPANSTASLAVASLDTLKDGLPHLLGHTLWEGRTNLARSAGQEYLNVEFGWNPLVSDIRSFATGITNWGKLQQQYTFNSGKDIRRRYSFPMQSLKTETVTRTGVLPGGPFDGSIQLKSPGVASGQVVRSRNATVEQWFSGAFTYHAPPEFFGETGEYIARSSEILGTDLTPDTLWQLAPWSWAVDWFSNIGDVSNNLNAYSSYGQVLRYGYIMEHTVVRDVYTFVGDIPFDPSKVKRFTGRPPTFTICCETKVRRRATPFGFGVSLSSLNPTQIAIMAALGLSFLA